MRPTAECFRNADSDDKEGAINILQHATRSSLVSPLALLNLIKHGSAGGCDVADSESYFQ